MVHRDWHIANGIPASRVLDKVNPPNQSRFGVTSAFLRADSPALGLHPSSAAQKESRTQATGHRCAEATAQPPSNQHACKALIRTVPCHACLHEITFRLRQGARAAICTIYSMCRMSPAAKLLRGLDSRKHPAHLPPVRLCLTTVVFLFCADACSSRPLRLTLSTSAARPMRLARERCLVR